VVPGFVAYVVVTVSRIGTFGGMYLLGLPQKTTVADGDWR